MDVPSCDGPTGLEQARESTPTWFARCEDALARRLAGGGAAAPDEISTNETRSSSHRRARSFATVARRADIGGVDT